MSSLIAANIKLRLADAKEPLEELLQLINHRLLFLCPGPVPAEAGYRRQQLVNVGAGSLYLSVPEGVGQKLPRFLFPQLLLTDDLRQLLFPFFGDKTVPFDHHIVHIVDACNEFFYNLFLTAKLRACIHSLLNGNENLLVVAMGVMVLLHQHQNVVYIYFYLADEKAGNKLLYRIINSLKPELREPSFGSDVVSADNLFRFQSEVIRKLAAEESCVIIGRCAEYLLKGTEGLLRVYVYADMDYRIRRITRLGYYEPAALSKFRNAPVRTL